MVQWLRLCAPNSGGPDSVPGQGTIYRMPQLRVCIWQLKVSHAATKTQHGQKHKYFLKKTTMDGDIINYTETIGEANLVANEKKTCLVLDTLRLRNLQSL